VQDTYDAIVIGAGQGGVPLAKALANAGRHTALIERTHVGGTCVNTGCTPTKTLIASARVAYLARRGADYGVHTGPVQVDLAQVRARKREVVEQFRGGSLRGIQNTERLTLYHGEASFESSTGILVRLNEGGQKQLQAGQIFINTGARASDLRIEGLDAVTVLHEDTLMELDRVPDHLVIIGGGYLGLEFGQMFRRFGSRVTLLEAGDRLMPREDDDIIEATTQILKEDGIEVRFNARAQRVEALAGGRFRLMFQEGDQPAAVEGSHLMIAAGRTPNTEALNLPAAGVKTDDRGHILVDERLETHVPGIFALGDVKGGPAFTHIAYDDYRVLCANLLYNNPTTIEDRLVPYTVFIDPQLARVGLTEKQAREKYANVKLAKMPASHVARAIETHETRGLLKAVIDGDTGQILGCAFLVIDGGEVMSAVQIAMMGKLPFTALRDGVFAHPTLTESLNNLFATVEE